MHPKTTRPLPKNAHDLPSGELSHFAMERSTMFNGKIHYFYGHGFNCYITSPGGIQNDQGTRLPIRVPRRRPSLDLRPGPWNVEQCPFLDDGQHVTVKDWFKAYGFP